MELSTAFLAEFIGLYIIIVSTAFILRPESFVEYARSFADDITLRYSIALVELAAGLLIVLTHNVWEMTYSGLITVFGWMMLVEAVFHLGASKEQEHKLIDSVVDDTQLRVFGVLALMFGFYLVTHGFTVL